MNYFKLRCLITDLNVAVEANAIGGCGSLGLFAET